MITEVKAYPFARPCIVTPGDRLRVSQNGGTLVEYKSDFTVTWTHSIMFKLNGEVQWTVGTQKTIDWLRSMQESTALKRPLTPQEQHDVMYGRGGY